MCDGCNCIKSPELIFVLRIFYLNWNFLIDKLIYYLIWDTKILKKKEKFYMFPFLSTSEGNDMKSIKN